MVGSPTAEFLEASEAYGIVFDSGDLARLERYLDLLLEANKAFNLTRITEPGEAWMRHVFDSLTLMPFLAELGDGAGVADIGSGGGAPGIPLAIMHPGFRFALIEATGKKAVFLRETAAALGLDNVEVVQERAESLGQDHKAHRSAYNAVTARAVGRIAVVSELAVPLAKVGGLVLLIKGEKAEEEIEEAKRALHMLHASVAGVAETPTGRVVVLEKRRETPRDYPRRPGEPKRAPLGV